MNKIRQFVNDTDIGRFRLWVQILAFGFLIYGGTLAINVGMDLPTFSCPYANKSVGTCYFIGLQHRLVLPFKDFISFRGLGIVTATLSFLIWFVFLNKAWCGFICPLGTIQDMITRLRSALGIPYGQYSRQSFVRLKKIKYLLLALLILIPIGIANSIPGTPKLSHDWATPFCMICPGRTVLPLFTGDTSQLGIDFSSKTKMVFTALGMSVTGIFFVGAFVHRRFFCFFCPMSAFQYIFSKLGMLRLVKDGGKCTKCGDCYRACDMGIHDIADDVQTRNVVRDDCMMCFKCVAACPEDHALKVQFLRLTAYESTQEGFFKRMEKKVRHEK